MSIVSITLTVRTELLLLYKMLTVFRFYQKKITVCKKIFCVLPKNISALRRGLRVHRADLAAAELADGGGGGAAHPLPVDGAGGRRPHAPHLDGHTQGKQIYLSTGCLYKLSTINLV